MNGNDLLNLWESQKLFLLNIEKFAEGTFTWVDKNNVKHVKKDSVKEMVKNIKFNSP